MIASAGILRDPRFQGASQHDQLRLVTVTIAHSIGGLDEPVEFGRRVMRRNPPGTVPKQILSVLKTHSGRPKPTAKRVLQIVHPNSLKIRTIATAQATRM